MAAQPGDDAALGDFAERLRELRPTPVPIDRDRLMFLAGRQSIAAGTDASGSARVKLWRGISFTSLTACCVLTVALWQVTQEAPSEQTADVTGRQPGIGNASDANTAGTGNSQTDGPHSAVGQPRVAVPFEETDERSGVTPLELTDHQAARHWLTSRVAGDLDALEDTAFPDRPRGAARVSEVNERVLLQTLGRRLRGVHHGDTNSFELQQLLDHTLGEAL